MSILFLLVLASIMALKVFASVVTNRAEKKEKRAADRVDALKKQLEQAETPSGKRDYLAEARRANAVQEFGGATAHADRCLEKAVRWSDRSKALSAALAWVWGVKGRAMPYTAGLVDCTTVMIALDQVAVASGMSLPELLQTAVAWITG